MVFLKRLFLFSVIALLCAALGLFAWSRWVQRVPAGVPVIEVSSEVSLYPLAVLTTANPTYTYSPTPLREKLRATNFWRYVPRWARGWLTALRALPGWKEQLYSDPYSVAIIYGFKYPAEWDATRNFEDVSDALREALNAGHIEFSGVSYGEEWVTNGMPVEVNMGYGSADPAQRRVRVQLRNVPLYLPEIKFGVKKWGPGLNDERVRLYTLANPYYQAVEPIARPTDPLPATRTDGSADLLEVKLRAFISGTALLELESRKRGTSIGHQISSLFSSLSEAAGGKDASPDANVFPDSRIPDSGIIPASLFPVETREFKRKSVAVIEINQPWHDTPEWDLDMCEVTYGAKRFPFWHNRNGRSNGRQVFLYMDGDVSVLPQPLVVTAILKRARNFPPDEEQTVEFALPKNNETVQLNQELKFWYGTHRLESLQRLVDGSSETTGTPGLPRVPHSLCLSHNNFNSARAGMGPGGYSIQCRLTGPGGKSVVPDIKRDSSLYSSIYSPHVNQEIYFSTIRTDKQRRYDYDDFTTANITIRHERPAPRRFEFVVSPEKAAGPPVPVPVGSGAQIP